MGSLNSRNGKERRPSEGQEEGRWDEEKGRGGKEQGGTQSREGVPAEQEQKGRRRGGGGKL